MLKWLISKLPEPLFQLLLSLRNFLRSISYKGSGRYCPICKKSFKRFRSVGQGLCLGAREDAQCPFCGSLERHRMLWIFLNLYSDLFSKYGKKVLHIAPESCLETIFRKKIGNSYITADLLKTRVNERMDITNILYKDQTFDVILCSHVLEHVNDDKKAIREFHRVLKNDGWMVVMVPITVEVTFEDFSITRPEDRLRVFGQADHVRRYGRDFLERLECAGFLVQVISPGNITNGAEIINMSLTQASGDIFYCTKQDNYS